MKQVSYSFIYRTHFNSDKDDWEHIEFEGIVLHIDQSHTRMLVVNVEEDTVMKLDVSRVEQMTYLGEMEE